MSAVRRPLPVEIGCHKQLCELATGSGNWQSLEPAAAVKVVDLLRGERAVIQELDAVMPDVTLRRSVLDVVCVVGSGGNGFPLRTHTATTFSASGEPLAKSASVLIQLEGCGKTGVCPGPPDTAAPEKATSSYFLAATTGLGTCLPGQAVVLDHSVAHTQLEQDGRRLVATVYQPARGATIADLRAASCMGGWAKGLWRPGGGPMPTRDTLTNEPI